MKTIETLKKELQENLSVYSQSNFKIVHDETSSFDELIITDSLKTWFSSTVISTIESTFSDHNAVSVSYNKEHGLHVSVLIKKGGV